MNSLSKCQAVLSFLETINSETQAHPGLSEPEIRGQCHAIGLTPESELVALYTWHNGIDHLNAFFHLLSLNEAIDSYKGYRDLKQDTPEFQWQEGWFPLLDMNGDVQICLDLENQALYAIDPECDTTEKIADHYDDYLDALLALLESGKFRFDEDSGSLEADMDAWEELQQHYAIRNAWD